MKTLYINRLITYANYLNTIVNHPEQGLTKDVAVVILQKEGNFMYKMKYPCWAIDELVHVFPEWEFDDYGDPILNKSDEGTFFDICDFFDLSLEEIIVFDMEGRQEGRFGEKKLDSNANAHDLSFNLLKLAEYKSKAQSIL